MMLLSQEDLIKLNHRGILPNEKETGEEFLERINLLEKMKPTTYPESVAESFLHCEKIFDVHPDWVPIVEEQKDLAPWQGAVLWVQIDQKGSILPLVQISPRLSKSVLKKWYSREEVIAHELIHAIRVPLQAVRFEEMIAYHTSKSAVRRYLGSLIRRPFEVYVLLIALVLSWIGMWWSPLLYLPWIVCLFGFGRLFFTRYVFNRCRNKLKLLLQDKEKSLALMARLNDREIALFAKSSPEEIRKYVDVAGKVQLRWRMLASSYTFKPTFSA